MAGWRIGFAIGNPFLVETLRQIKTNLDYGLFPAIRSAATKALSHTNGYMDNMRKTYCERRDIFVGGLNSLGWQIKPPQGTMYVWFKTPKNLNASEFSMLLLEKTGIVVAPGTAFGENGEGYVRAALVDSTERIAEAVERVKKAGIRFA
jgi:LL-diaminopimelate aminotransferase